MKHKSILFFLAFVFISSFVSCIKEKECPKPPSPDEISACDVDIDESISFDTLWNIKVGDHSLRKYFDKYFVAYYYRDEKFDFYLAETGELFRSIDSNQLEESFFHYMQIIGDYACGTGSGIHPVITKYNLLTDEIQVSDSIEFGLYYIFKEDYFYYSNKHAILKMNYKGETLDTIMKYNGEIPPFDISGLLAYDKYLIAVYHDDDSKIMQFLVIDTENKNIKENLMFSAGSFIDDCNITDNFANVSCSKLKFSYNLNTGDYFIDDGDYYADKLYSISDVSINEYEQTSIVLFHTLHYLNAYDFNDSDLLWKCYDYYSRILPLHLVDSKGNKFTYLIKSDRAFLSLIDPYTGIIKAHLKNDYLYDIHYSHIYNNDEIILLNDKGELTKIKIIKK